MKFLITLNVVFLLALIFPSKRTACQELYRIAKDHYYAIESDSTKKDSTLFYAHETRKYAEQFFGQSSIQYLASLNRVATTLFYKFNQYDSAKQVWLNIVAKIQSTPDSNYEIQSDIYWNLYVNSYLEKDKSLDSAFYFANKYLSYQQQVINKPVDLINEIIAVAYNFDINKEDSATALFYSRALELRKEIWGAKNAEITKQLDSLIQTVFSETSYDFRNDLYKVGDTTYTYYQLDSIGRYYSRSDASNEEFQSALSYLIRAKDQAILDYSDSSHEFYKSLRLLASYFNEFPEAKSISIYCLNTILNDLESRGKMKSIDYADALFDLAELKHEQQYEEAIAILEKVLPIYQSLYSQKSEPYINCLTSLSWWYAKSKEDQQREHLAFQSMTRAVELAKSTCGINTISYLEVKKDLGALYKYDGRLDEAEKTLLEVYKTYNEKFHPAPTDEFLEELCVQLHWVYGYKYELSKWLFWLNKCEEIKIAKGDTLSYDYLNILDNIISANQYINNWAQAKKYLDKQEAVLNYLNDTSSVEYAFSLMAKKDYYIHTKEYDKCESLFQKIISIQQERFEKYNDNNSHSGLASAYMDYADFNFLQGNYDKAYELIQPYLTYLRAWNYDSAAGATDAYERLGAYFLYKKQADSAFHYYDLAIQCQKNSFFERSEIYFKAQSNKALAFWHFNQSEKAEELLASACESIKEQMIKGMAGFSEKEKQTYTTTLNEVLNKYHNLHHTIYQAEPVTNKRAYNFILQSKGLLLNTSLFVEKQIKASADKRLQNTYADLKQTKTMLAKVYQLGEAQSDGISLDRLETRAARLEKALSEQSNVLADFQKANQVSFSEVQAGLQPGEAAIEFVSFPYFNGTDFTDSLLYAAYIVKAGLDTPVYVPLNGVAGMNAYVQNQQSKSRGGVVIKSQERKETFKELYQYIWQPLTPFLEGVKKVSLAPDGILNSVAFAALQDTGGQYLVNKYDLKILLSTRDIAQKNKTQQSQAASALLFGGAKYDLKPIPIKDAINGHRSLPDDLNGTQGWNYLPGTLSEAVSVGQILKKQGGKVVTIVGEAASEQQFKTMSVREKPSIIHIATHGFYFPVTTESGVSGLIQKTYSASDNPLLRTGLLFSGANWAWQGKLVKANQEDGILTAYELSNLDLSATKLMVLSACETGVGEIQNGEGVYGLQRAIRQAGVSKMIVSLWPVPDKETAEMMQYFYLELSKEKEIRTAFKKAQMNMLKKYPGEPSLWAGFTLIE
ncbi:CHAT domain-containing protein [Flavisolibacter tropicus]|uniref:CHAT domain-containing protein n=1 Tax=Flavisolibacter tropicus TaxID=1492898 RepID=A0A172U1Y0_9BACT|nr:CHAT domain-containing tetratricopeptide repeat protein [Flavisolibacter tropicus]ANE53033.1 hypothetical protein SY85_23720 [Flavisolibacter tropicus]